MNVGLRIPGDQRQITPALPLHLVNVLTVGEGVQSFADASGNNLSLVLLAFCLQFVCWIEHRFLAFVQVCIRRIPPCHQITSVDRVLCCR